MVDCAFICMDGDFCLADAGGFVSGIFTRGLLLCMHFLLIDVAICLCDCGGFCDECACYNF